MVIYKDANGNATPIYQPRQTGLSTQLGGTDNLFNALIDEQKQFNKLQMEREDTAYQRMVADMKAAGLNPWTGISSGGLSSSSYVPPVQSALNSVLQVLSFNKDSAKVNNDTIFKIFKLALPFLAILGA